MPEQKTIPMNIIEKKGLGKAVNTAMLGEESRKEYREYARIIRLDGGDNVEIMNFVTQKKVYLFPRLVVKQEAKDEYDGLK